MQINQINTSKLNNTHSPTKIIPNIKTHNSKYKLKDITILIDLAKKEMEIGEMITHTNFSLLKSIPAIELMQPKIDPGIYHENIMTINKAISLNLMPKILSTKNLIVIFDQLLKCQVSWWHGFNFADSIFTCMYLHNMNLVDSSIFKALANCILKTCNIIIEIMEEAEVYVEGEIITDKFNFDFNENMSYNKVEEDIQREINKLELEFDSDKDDSDKQDITSLKIRLSLSLHLLSTHYYLKNKNYKNSKENHLSLIKIIKIIKKEKNKYKNDQLLGFDHSINRGLIANSIPNYSPLKTFKFSLTYLEKSYNQLLNIYKWKDITDFNHINMIYSKLYKLKLNCIIRSHFYIMITYLPLNTYIFNSFNKLYFIKPRINDFPIEFLVQKISLCLSPLFKYFCVPTSTQYESLISVLLNYSKLIDHITSLIQFSGPVTHYKYILNWVKKNNLDFCMRYIQLAMELRLYSDYEFVYVFWYQERLIDDSVRVCSEMNMIVNNELNSNIYLMKSKKYLLSALYKLMHLVLSVKLNKENKFGSEKIRYENRFQIFKNHIFSKYMEYEEFLKKIKEEVKVGNMKLCDKIIISLKLSDNLIKKYVKSRNNLGIIKEYDFLFDVELYERIISNYNMIAKKLKELCGRDEKLEGIEVNICYLGDFIGIEVE